MRYLFFLLLGVSLAAVAQDAPQAVPVADASPAAAPDEAEFKALTEDVVKSFQDYWPAEEGAAGPDATELNLRKCVDMALANSGQALAAQDDVDAAQARIGQARAQMFPHLKTDAAFIHTEPVGGGGLSALTGGGGGLLSTAGGAPFQIVGALLQPGGVNLGELGSGLFNLLMSLRAGSMSVDKDSRRDHFSATQVLYAGGQIRAAMRAAQFLAQSQEWRKQATLNNLVFDVKRSYYGCLLARAMVRVAEESVKTFERHVADAQQMFDVGLISNFEVLRAKTELGARQADATAARNGERLALANLRRVICVPQDTNIRLARELGSAPVTAPLEGLVKQAFEKRPELAAMEKGIRAAEQNVKRTKGEYKPRAAANADWVNMDGGGGFAAEGWTFTVGAEWDIYAGGKRKADVAEAKAQISSLQHQEEDLRRLVELDVRQAYIQLQDAMAKIKSEKGTVELGREGLRLAQLRFQEGVGTQAETLDAELALTGAETKLVQALHDYAVAQAAILKAVGESESAEAREPVS